MIKNVLFLAVGSGLLIFLSQNSLALNCDKALSPQEQNQIYEAFTRARGQDIKGLWAVNSTGRLKAAGDITLAEEITVYGFPYRKNGAWVVDVKTKKDANHLETRTLRELSDKYENFLDTQISKRLGAPWILSGETHSALFESAELVAYDKQKAAFKMSDGKTRVLSREDVQRQLLFQRDDIAVEAKKLAQSGSEFEIVLFDEAFPSEKFKLSEHQMDFYRGYFIRPLKMNPVADSIVYVFRHESSVETLNKLLRQGIDILYSPGEINSWISGGTLDAKFSLTQKLHALLETDPENPITILNAGSTSYQLAHEMVHYQDLRIEVDQHIMKRIKEVASKYKLKVNSDEMLLIRNAILEQRAHSVEFNKIADDFAKHTTDDTLVDFIKSEGEASPQEVDMVMSGEASLGVYAMNVITPVRDLIKRLRWQSREAIDELRELATALSFSGNDRLEAWRLFHIPELAEMKP